jgi:hypothetical protein
LQCPGKVEGFAWSKEHDIELDPSRLPGTREGYILGISSSTILPRGVTPAQGLEYTGRGGRVGTGLALPWLV